MFNSTSLTHKEVKASNEANFSFILISTKCIEYYYEYLRFGFRLCEDANQNLEDRAERLKKHAESIDSQEEEESK